MNQIPKEKSYKNQNTFDKHTTKRGSQEFRGGRDGEWFWEEIMLQMGLGDSAGKGGIGTTAFQADRAACTKEWQ